VAGELVALEGLLDVPSDLDELREIGGIDVHTDACGGHERVQRPAVCDVDFGARRPHAASDHERRHVAERHGCDGTSAATHAGHYPARGHVDRHVDLAVGFGGDPSRLDRPGPEGDRAVPTGRGVPILVPEQRAQVGAFVVGRDEKAAVHVGVAPRLMAQQPPDAIDLLGRGGALTALSYIGPRDLHLALGDDPEGLAGGVIVGRRNLHRRQSPAALAVDRAAPLALSEDVLEAGHLDDAMRPASSHASQTPNHVTATAERD
jgi:hypothetical protein